MRTFGVEADNLIDVELAYGANNYKITWFQNGLQRDISVPKATIHFVGAKTPLGNVTIDYMEISTDYLNFLEEDAIRIDITEDNSKLTVGTFYVAPGFTKNKYDALYTAYSSLINLGLKLDAWNEAPEGATIGTIVHHFIDPLEIVFDVEPISTVTFNASMTDFSSITLGELLGYCACIERCNYVLRGNVLHKVVPAIEIAKEYNIDDVVYTENLRQNTSDAALDYIKVNYKTVVKETDEDGQATYDFNDASYICKDGTETCGFELNIGLIPTSESALQSYYSAYFTSIKGMDCNGYNISFMGDARVEVGDKLKFSNNTDSAILNVAELTWEWDGGLKCTVSSGSESSSSSENGFSIQQVVSQIKAMTNAVKNVQYNAVYTNELYAKTAELGFASIGELTAEVAKMGLMTANQANIAYAKIDLSNIQKSTVGTLLADIGLISEATIVDGHVTGYLDSVSINANDITAGTLSVDRLVIRGSKESLVYELNNITGALQAASVDTLNGEIITQRTINADRLVAKSVTANELAVGSVIAEKILGKSITAEKLNVASLSAISANLGVVTAGIIQSANYSAESSGMKMNIADGSIDSKYFKLNSSGEIMATGGTIAGLSISDAKLYTDVFSLETRKNGVNFLIKDTDQTELFGIHTSHPANSGMMNAMNAINFNEVTIAADDINLLGNIYLNDKTIETILNGYYKKINLGTNNYIYTYNCISINGVSLNSITESGLYYCQNTPGRPEGVNGYMIAITHGGTSRGLQVYFAFSNNVYFRMNPSGAWGVWERIHSSLGQG